MRHAFNNHAQAHGHGSVSAHPREEARSWPWSCCALSEKESVALRQPTDFVRQFSLPSEPAWHLMCHLLPIH